MSDLISRQVLLNWANEQREEVTEIQVQGKYRSIFTREVLITMQRCISAFEIAINNQPTAYDIDKVVEEFDKKYNNSLWIKGNKEFSITRNELIEIVKQGGVGKKGDLMKATGIIRRFDDLGRIAIPKEIRRQLFGTAKNSEGQPMEISMDGENIVLRKYVEQFNDVCEWSKYLNHPFDWLVGCELGLIASKQGDYCPYCGKKIKVV